MSEAAFDHIADVVVLGTGAAGSAAAIAAHDAGARVVILEKMDADRAGGNTRISGGCWFENRDPQRAAVYLRSLCGDRPLPDAVVTTWAEGTARVSEWIASLGANVQAQGDYSPEYPELDGSDAYGGYLAVDGVMGEGRVFAVLQRAIAERGIEVRYETPGRRLLTDPDGAVTGVEAEHEGKPVRFGARGGVVLATGGFQADRQMVRDYLHLIDPPLWGTPAATGDGHKMATAVGADLWHMNNHMSIAGIAEPGSMQGYYQAFNFAHGFIWVGADGTRFINELPQVGHGQARVHGDYDLFPLRTMHIVFDEATRRAGPVSLPRKYLAVGWQLLVEGADWSDDNLTEIERGLITRADSLAELAAAIGVDPVRLEAAIERWNADCAAGRDSQFGRPRATLTPLAEPPFYAISGPPMLGWTNGGPRRNERSEVLNAFGETIPGLYAAGEISSSYSWSKDGGFHMADSFVFGRIAGQQAAERAG